MAGLDRGLVRGRGKRERGKDLFIDISAPVFLSVVTIFRPLEILSLSVYFMLRYVRAVIAHIQCSLPS